MLRAPVLALFVASLPLLGCYGGDTVNPSNPDASSSTPKDASSDGASKDGASDGGTRDSATEGGTKDEGADGGTKDSAADE
jgi:hypothetical protein